MGYPERLQPRAGHPPDLGLRLGGADLYHQAVEKCNMVLVVSNGERLDGGCVLDLCLTWDLKILGESAEEEMMDLDAKPRPHCQSGQA